MKINRLKKGDKKVRYCDLNAGDLFMSDTYHDDIFMKLDETECGGFYYYCRLSDGVVYSMDDLCLVTQVYYELNEVEKG